MVLFSLLLLLGRLFFFIIISSLLLNSYLIVYGWFRKLFMERIYKLRIRMSLHRVYPFNEEEKKSAKLYSQNRIVEQRKKNKNQTSWYGKHLLGMYFVRFVGCVFALSVRVCVCMCVSVWVVLWHFLIYIFSLKTDAHTPDLFKIFAFVLCVQQPLLRGDYIIYTIQYIYMLYVQSAFVHCFQNPCLIFCMQYLWLLHYRSIKKASLYQIF